MVEMSCEAHDEQAANTQFITHTVGRVLGQMNVQSTSINTKGYESLLNLVQNTSNDSFDLYYGLFMYNQVCRLPLSTLSLYLTLYCTPSMLRSQSFPPKPCASRLHCRYHLSVPVLLAPASPSCMYHTLPHCARVIHGARVC